MGQATDVRLEFLPAQSGFGPTVALTYMLCGHGVWAESVEIPPQFVMPDGTRARMTPASGHPRHTVFPVVTESPKLATFVWDARRDGIDPARRNWIRHHLAFRIAYSNLVCNQVPTRSLPRPPPRVPTDPGDPVDPESPPATPSVPGSGPVVPVDIGDPVVIPETQDTGAGLSGSVTDQVEPGLPEVSVPGMPDPVEVGNEPTEASDVDHVPADPEAGEGTLHEQPGKQGGSNLPLEGSMFDPHDDLAPEAIPVTSDPHVVTEDPEAPGGQVSHGSEHPRDFQDPGGDPGSPLPFPNKAGGAALKWPVAFNPYQAPQVTIDTTGKNRYVDGDTGVPLYLEVFPYSIIPYGQPVTVVMGIRNQSASDLTGVGLVAEYIDADGDRVTVGIGPGLQEVLTGESHAEGFAFESAGFEPGDTGVLRAYVVNPDLTCRAFLDRPVYLEPEHVRTADVPDLAPMTVAEALGGVTFHSAGVFNRSTHPIFYLRASASSGALAVTLGPVALAGGITARLNFGGFDGAGARTAATHSATQPLKTPNGILIDPDSHHVALTGLVLVPGTWYWVQVERLTGAVSPNHNFHIFGGGFIDPNEAEAIPEFQSNIREMSAPVVVHPRNEVTALMSSSGLLDGTIRLPHEGSLYMLVNEANGEAVVVESVNQTDVQANALPPGARIPAQPGDSVMVFLIGPDNDMRPVARYPVNA